MEDPVLFTIGYALGTVVFVPRTGLNLAAGWLYGPWLGTVIAMVASLVGSILAFLLGRRLLPAFIEHMARKASPIRALDVVARRFPIRLTALWHLSLVLPFAAINYYMGAARVRLDEFLIGKVIGVVPGTVAYVLIGATVVDAGVTPALGVAGVCFAVLLVFWIGRAARRELERL